MVQTLHNPLNNFETFFCEYIESIIESQGGKVIIGKLKNSVPNLDDLVYLKNDFEISTTINNGSILKSKDLIRTEEGFQIIKENYNGISFEKYIRSVEINISLFLKLALELTKLLKSLHQSNLIVKEFTTDNILIVPETLELKICSLGSSSLLKRERVEITAERPYYGPLSHIAPEQTGRIGRSIDYRSDYYSLGTILYQLLCKRNPFNYTDPLEMIHAHIAKKAFDPKSLKSEIPQAVSNLVMKLLEKNSEDRYQSAEGILFDLEECQRQWSTNSSIENFNLGSKDFSSIFRISEKLYGRKLELEILKNTWQSIKNDRMALLLVAGYSGIGKTKLINEIRKPVLESSGIFISGKFDQFTREIPYNAFGLAFNMLIQQILSENDEEILQWQNAIYSNLGEHCSVISGIVSNFEKLVGQQPALLDIGPVETKKRFFESFLSFLKIFEIRNKLVCIFIDDLQWADSGSLDLIQYMLANPLKNILLIGAYRDNEVDASHPLSLTVKNIEKTDSGKIYNLKLNELEDDSISELVSDSLHTNTWKCKELNQAIISKTRGNPFFVKQFLEKLVEEGKIFFNSSKNEWDWNIDAVNSVQLTDYVVDLVLSRLKKMNLETQEIISLAACIGNIFDLDTLSIISQKNKIQLAELLAECISHDFIYPIGSWKKYHEDFQLNEIRGQLKDEPLSKFRFQHDRIQQAAYAIIPEKDQRATHLRIGRLLLGKLSSTEFEENLFDIINQLNLGRTLINNDKEKKELAQLNHKAAIKAAKNNAIKPSLHHYEIGMELIGFDTNSDLFKDLLIGRSEIEYLLGNFQKSEDLFDQALEKAESNLTKAEILCRKMALYENTQRQQLAIDTAKRGLKLLGMDLPVNANPLHVMKELITVKFLLRNKSTESLLNNKLMDSPEKKLIMKFLMNLWGPVYLLQKQNLLAFKILRMVNLSIKYGNSIESAMAYAFYGYVTAAQLKAHYQGYNYSVLGIDLNNKLKDSSLRSKVLVIAVGCVAHFKKPYKDSISQLWEGYNAGIESNDLIYAAYSLSFLYRCQFLSGEDLDTLYEKITGYIQMGNRLQVVVVSSHTLAWAKLIADLADYRPDEKLFGNKIDDDSLLSYYKDLQLQQNLPLPLVNFYCTRAMYHYIMGDYNKALEYCELAEPLLPAALGLPEFLEHSAISCLSSLACVLENRHLNSKQKNFGKKHFKILRSYAASSPENYEAKYILAQAELAHAESNFSAASEFYAKALESAIQSDTRFIVAIVLERMALFFNKQNNRELSEKYIKLSLIEYQNWKATAKTRILFNKYTYLENDIINKGAVLSAQTLDLETMLKASAALAEEVVLEKLLEKLLLVVIENAGAQNGYLIRSRNNQLFCDASSRMINNNICEISSIKLDEIPYISHSIVRKVNNINDTIIIDDVKQDPLFLNDPQLKQLPTRSILCMPIQSKGKATAILYLDNEASSHAFTKGRLELLKLLSGQMAVSIENAQLYQNLEDKVKERTYTIERQKLELEEEKRKTDDLLLNILPDEIAAELKKQGFSKPRRHENVTILFTDFEKFTMMSETMSPEDIVEFVDYFYKEFDKITEKYGIEKIKTIGDSYMCVSGLPKFTSNHAENAVKAALEIVDFVEKFNKQREIKSEPYCRIRIGLHTGPVVAGVVGLNKFAYDIWGDSVNTASRLQTVCEPGRVNVSKTTYELIKSSFECEHRGKVKMKYKDELDMYYIINPKS